MSVSGTFQQCSVWGYVACTATYEDLLWTCPGTKTVCDSVLKGVQLNSDQAEDYERWTMDNTFRSLLQCLYEKGLHAYI